MAPLHGKSIQVFAGNSLKGWDISSWLNKITAEGSAGTAETSTFGNNSKTYIVGLLEGKLSFEGIHEFAPAGTPTGIDPILFDTASRLFANDVGSTPGETTIVVLPAGGGGALADRAYSLKGILSAAPIDSPLDNVVGIKGELVGTTRVDFGSVLFPLASRSGSSSSSSIDDGAAAPALTAGAMLWVATTVYTGTSALFKLQHSVDDSIWVDTGASITVTSKSVQRTPFVGTLNRYVRVNLTTTAATHTSAAGYTRRYS